MIRVTVQDFLALSSVHAGGIGRLVAPL
jgi:hypothetical protein